MTRRRERRMSMALAGWLWPVADPAVCTQEPTVGGRILGDWQAELSNASPIVRVPAVTGVFRFGAPAVLPFLRAIGAARTLRSFERR